MKVLIALEMSSMCSETAPFCLLNVANFPDGIQRPSALFEKAKIGILKRLDYAAESLKQAGWNVRTEIVEGKPRSSTTG
jgi:hypothetical protein